MGKNLAEFLAGHPWIIVLVLLWTLPWKAAALWRSAGRKQLGWFLVMLVLNTLGILEIFYLAFFSKKEQPVQETPAPSNFEERFKADQEKLKKVATRKIIM